MNKMLKKTSLADVVISAFLGILAIISVFPFYNMLLLSFAKYEDVVRPGIYLFPKSFTLVNYKIILSDSSLIRAFGNSLFITIVGTLIAMLITTMAAYALSKKELPGRKFIFSLCLFTMYFGGGLIPWYLVVSDLGFVDSIWVMIIPSCFSVYNMILMRNFFSSLPASLEESARIDGANDMRIMWQIILPISKPILATVALFYAVFYWNEWYHGMLFISRNENIVPLQLLLRRIVTEAQVMLGSHMAEQFRDANIQVYQLSVQMAATTVATVPILMVYPFVQKYFSKGVMLGAVKE